MTRTHRGAARNRRLRVVVALSVVALSVAGLVTGWGDEPVSDPRRATTCAGLVGAGRVTAEAVLDLLGDRSLADLMEDDPDEPFAEVDRVLRAEAFAERAEALGCGAAELVRRACTSYQGLSAQARGEAGREFLAPYFAACD